MGTLEWVLYGAGAVSVLAFIGSVIILVIELKKPTYDTRKKGQK